MGTNATRPESTTGRGADGCRPGTFLPLLTAEQARVRAEQRATQVVVLPLVREKTAHEAGTSGDERPVQLDGMIYPAYSGDYVVRLDGTTCLQLWNAAGQVTCLDGDPLQVASVLQKWWGP